jgi:hypothetical protein
VKRPSFVKGKKQIVVYIDEPIFRELKVYAAETDQYLQDVIKPLSDEFTQSALKLIAQIKELKQEAEAKRLKEIEEARIAAEHPMEVSGVPVEPVGEVIIEPQTC